MSAAAPPHLEEFVTISIKVVVIDETGEPVPDAVVKVARGPNTLKGEMSNLEGQVQFSDLSLQPGIHSVLASKLGYDAAAEDFFVKREMEKSTLVMVIRVGKLRYKPQQQEQQTQQVQTQQQQQPREKFYRVRVFFATDRNEREGEHANYAFGGDRSPEGKLTLGLCSVSVPESHRVGGIESPSIFKLEFRENPEKHIVVLNLSKMRQAHFFESVGMMGKQSPEQNAFVFIHGYCVTFIEAVRRTAQLAFDLSFRGLPICYSWPSKGKYSGYMADEASVEWTVPHLLQFLKGIADLDGIKTIHLIAHSMGNRALVNCLDRIAQLDQGGAKPIARFQQTILAAPDIDAGVFRQLAQRFTDVADRTTLYASSGDLALQMSQQFHRYPRAGESGPGIVVVPGIDTVDVSTVPAGFLGHSYYGGSRSVLTDVYELLKSGSPPPRFGLKQSSSDLGPYWIFMP